MSCRSFFQAGPRLVLFGIWGFLVGILGAYGVHYNPIRCYRKVGLPIESEK